MCRTSEVSLFELPRSDVHLKAVYRCLLQTFQKLFVRFGVEHLRRQSQCQPQKHSVNYSTLMPNMQLALMSIVAQNIGFLWAYLAFKLQAICRFVMPFVRDKQALRPRFWH